MKKKVVLSVAVVVLVVMVAMMCAACTPNSDKLKEKFEKNDYVVTVITSKTALAMYGENVEKVLTATPKSTGILDINVIPDVIVVWYTDSNTAKEQYKKAQDNLKEAGDDAKDYKVVKKGNVVASGKKDAVKLV